MLGGFFGELARLLSSQPGLIGVALAVAGVGLLVRLYIGRKRLSYEEEFNSKIGIVPPFNRTAGPSSDPAASLLAVFDNLSVVLIKVRNAGRASITAADYRKPMRFYVRDAEHYIVDFRTSAVVPDELFLEGNGTEAVDTRDRNWLVSALSAAGERPQDPLLRPDLRRTLPGSLLEEPQAGALSADDKNRRRQLLLPATPLGPGDGFDLVVCLRSDTLGDGVRRTDYRFEVELAQGAVINRNAPRRRPSPTQRWAAAVVVLAVLLGASLLVRPQAPPYCATGDLRMVGSSAFAPTATTIAQGYRADCSGAQTTMAMAGSLEGIRELREAAPEDRSRLLAFSDGGAIGATEQLQRRPVAVLIYSVVVNRSSGVQDLTTAQVRAINSGAVRNWSQLGGADLPIRLVGRGPDSGSRQAFETYLLGGPEAPVSSNSCSTADRVPAAAVIRCERPGTAEVLSEIDRTPGAIGYADASPAAGYGNTDRVRVDGAEPTAEYLRTGYRFWTIEYAYTSGIAPGGGLLDRYLGYLSSDAAARRLREASYIPCVRSDRGIESLCQQNR